MNYAVFYYFCPHKSNRTLMKAKTIFLLICAAMGINLWLCGCGEDRWAAYATQTATDRWIDDSMRVWYYWAEEIPHTNKLNYFQAPATFFKSLLSSQDRFSTIDSLKSDDATTKGFTPSRTRSIASPECSYGIEYNLMQTDNDTYLAHVLYCVPESPADEAGVIRGDWIMALNGEPLTKSNYMNLLDGGEVEITVGTYSAEKEAVVAYNENPRKLTAARAVDDNPVHCVRAYDVNGTQVGYLTYNHFSRGRYNGTEYDEALREASAWLASVNVTELVLDLRYNNGGYVSCAQLLCTLLAPQEALGKELATMEYNSRQGNAKLMMEPSLVGNGANLNLKRLFVLTGKETASASELVMNCLSPYMEVIQIGATTVGKNMGARTFENEEQMVTMTPLVCKIYNSLGESDYEKGFAPDSPLRIDENQYLAHFLPFGDPQETLLSTALSLIAGGNGDNDGNLSGSSNAAKSISGSGNAARSICGSGNAARSISGSSNTARSISGSGSLPAPAKVGREANSSLQRFRSTMLVR